MNLAIGLPPDRNPANVLVDLHGLGFSHSSREAIFDETARHLREGRLFDVRRIAHKALRRERILSRCACAAQDVYAIADGGVCRVVTHARGEISTVPVDCDHDWIRAHVLLGVQPDGLTHHCPNLLPDLFAHRDARSLVRHISRVAERAEDALTLRDARLLGDAVNECRHLFSYWSRDRFVSPAVAVLAADLEKRVDANILGWKPPGAGAASAIAVVADDIHPVIELVEAQGWVAFPVVVTDGLRCRQLDSRPAYRVSAGYRFDFVGAADLGQDPRINESGICISCAIEPRQTVHVEIAG